MASPVQDAAPSAALVRRYGLLGSFPLQIDSTIVPVSIVDDVCVVRERFAAGITGRGPVALEFANTQLFNPANSGVLVKMEQVFISSDTAGRITFKPHDTALTVDLALTQWRDRRLGGMPVALMLALSSTTDFAFADRFWEFDLAVADETTHVPVDVTLLPGMGLCVTPNTVNRSLVLNGWWTETTLLPGE